MKRTIAIMTVFLSALVLTAAAPAASEKDWKKGPAEDEVLSWLYENFPMGMGKREFTYACEVDADKGTAVCRISEDIGNWKEDFYVPYSYDKKEKSWVADIDRLRDQVDQKPVEEEGLYTLEFDGKSIGVCFGALEYTEEEHQGETQLIIDAEEFGYGKAADTDVYELIRNMPYANTDFPRGLNCQAILQQGSAVVELFPDFIMLSLDSPDETQSSLFFLTQKGSAKEYGKWYEQYLGGNAKPDYTVGSVVEFGSFEQDNDTGNGAESLRWTVLEEGDLGILLLSKYVIDAQPVKAGSSIRSWLNQSFYNTAFTREERESIRKAALSAAEATSDGRDAEDWIFLLSIEEAEAYLPIREARIGRYTKYARARCADSENQGNEWWWLRSPGTSQNSTAGINGYGNISMEGVSSDYCGGIRPAMWVDRETLTALEDGGDFVSPGSREEYMDLYGSWGVKTGDWTEDSLMEIGVVQVEPMLVFQPDGTAYFIQYPDVVQGTYRISADYAEDGNIELELNGKRSSVNLYQMVMSVSDMPEITEIIGGQSIRTTDWRFGKLSDDWNVDMDNFL